MACLSVSFGWDLAVDCMFADALPLKLVAAILPAGLSSWSVRIGLHTGVDFSTCMFSDYFSGKGTMIASTEKPRVIVSACLLGNLVRFNGQHSRDLFRR